MKPELLHEQPPADHPEVAFFEPENEDISYCNCENAEQLTPYEGETVVDAILENATEPNDEPPRNRTVFAENTAFRTDEEKVEEILQTEKRKIASHKKKRPCNPYLQRTRTCQIALFRNPQDDEPIDSMRTESVRGITWRSLLAVMGLAIGGGIAAYQIIKAIAKKDLESKD